MKKNSNKQYWEELNVYKKRFLRQKQFPTLPYPYENRMQPIMHTGYFIFIRNKFIYLGLIKSMEDKNLYAAWSLLKSYWENVATFAYYYIEITELLKRDKIQEAFKLSRKMALGGRKFLTKEMVEKKGHTLADFFVPNISTMLNRIDEEWKKSTGESLAFREFYDTLIAEGGHTTFLGLNIAGKILPNGSQLPNVKKSWSKDDNSSILNFTSMSSLIFFYYWGKFIKISSH